MGASGWTSRRMDRPCATGMLIRDCPPIERPKEIPMPGLLSDVDPDGLLEFSVVYTDRSLNHMSAKFQGVMRDISALLKHVYHAHSAVMVPGSRSYGMEAVARQFATRQKVLVLRNGWFSYRWSQIFEMGQIPSEEWVLKARRTGAGP